MKKNTHKVEREGALLRMEKLIAELDKHRRLYYVLDQPDISDEAYDSLLRELESLENSFPELRSSVSPTLRVGGEPLSSFQKVTHAFRQWSFDDVFDYQELQAWHERIVKILKKIILLKNLSMCVS